MANINEKNLESQIMKLNLMKCILESFQITLELQKSRPDEKPSEKHIDLYNDTLRELQLIS